MKKNLFLTLILTSQIIVFAQNKTGYAKYQFEQNLESLKEAADTTTSENVKTVLLKMIEESKKNETIYFDLFFSENESLFTINNKLTTETNNLNLYKIEAQQIGTYYNNIKTNEIINQKKFSDSTFLIKIDKKNQWELTNEEKLIGKYLCKKALLKQGHIIDGIRSNNPIEVWYAPEIPTKTGPMGLDNLPGLIVEFKLNKLSTIKLIDLSLSEKININKPEKGKLVTQEEFRDFITKSKRMF